MKTSVWRLTLAGLMVWAFWGRAVTAQQEPLDLILMEARVLDGSGNPWIYTDIGIRQGRIVKLGRLAEEEALRRLSLAGRLVVPGFIDLHSHADDPLRGEQGLRSPDPRRRAAPNLVSQGVTTVVVNQDGRSPWPIARQAQELQRLGTGPNVILLVGHGTVRARVMGREVERPARAEEIEEMRRLVRQAMEEGAWGLSAGLEYPPGRWSTTEEMVALAQEVAAYGGVYISHQRSEGADPLWYRPSRHPGRPPSLLDAVEETITISRRTGVTAVASHLKAKGEGYWGSGKAAVELIRRARQEGVNIWGDHYPYATTGSDGNTLLLPPWVFQQGTGSYAERLKRVLEDAAEPGPAGGCGP